MASPIKVPINPATAAYKVQQPMTDLSAYPVLTEEVGYSPSPLARGSGIGAPGIGGGAPSLGQIVSKAIGDVLGWKLKQGDTKGFMGALTQSFTLTEVEGHVTSKWTPRTYAVQTDLAGGISGAQASVYARGKVALDQCLPLLDGLYKLDPEAIDEDVAALKAVARSQFVEVVNELGYLGGPRVARVNQYFSLLIGGSFPLSPVANAPVNPTNPDLVQGTLGTLRDLLGLNFDTQDFVNSVDDETNLSNFRIISDYVTGLAQTWLNNLNYLVLNTTTPFFGTQLVLMSRQLSVLAESIDEVRFTLDSVFIGPSERQTMELTFTAGGYAPIFLEDWLLWAYKFATDEGPRLIQDGGKFGVGNTVYPVVNQLLSIAQLIPAAPNMPPGFYTPRVQLSFTDLIEQLQDMANLAQNINHQITPEPDFGLPLEVSALEPSSISLSNPPSPLSIRVRGSGFSFGANAFPTVIFTGPGAPNPANLTTYFQSQGLLVAGLPAVPAQTGVWNVQVRNPDGSLSTALQNALTIVP